jgi:hypothetical protein
LRINVIQISYLTVVPTQYVENAKFNS